MRLGSLCTGVGGLDLAVEAVLGASLEWVAEIDPDASLVLDARFGVPNVGDFTTADVAPVDVLCAGFPCQPVSVAGRRAGTDDERWLFDGICALVGRMDPRPRLLVFENVAGLLTANGGDAMGRVVSGLARLGYVGSWRLLRASDIGAPHRRERWFCVAHAVCERQSPLAGSGSGTRGAWQSGRPTDRAGAATDASDDGRQRGRDTRRRRDGSADCDRFGSYGPAVERWERTFGRQAPDPTDGKRHLNPRFVEWMMGFPDGWVCDVLDRRTAALRCLGNAVVPQQAAAALTELITANNQPRYTG